MDLPIRDQNGELTGLEGFLNFVKMRETVFGVRDGMRPPSLKDLNSSIQSAYEVKESPRNEYDPSTSFSRSESQNILCDLLKKVSENSNGNVEEVNTSTTIETHETAQVSPSCENDVIIQEQIEEKERFNSSMYSLAQSARSATNESHGSEYDEYKFLKAAIGEELLEEMSFEEFILSPTASIPTDIPEPSITSSVVEPRSHRRKNRKPTETASNMNDRNSLSLNDTLLEKISLNRRDSVSETRSYLSNTTLNEAIPTDPRKKLTKNRIFVLETIINQSEKALEYGRRKSRSFIGSAVHLEAERTLLLCRIRRQALINTLHTIEESPTGSITIKNLSCTLIMKNEYNSSEQYYVCILQYKTIVYSTKIAAPNKLGWIDFGGSFIFDNVTNTFNIKIGLYTIQPLQVTQKCISLSFLHSTSKIPTMKLIGETHIGIINRKQEKFQLSNSDGFGEHKISALIQTSIKWPNTLRGFLTIGTEKLGHQPIWNRRWCVLGDGKLMYYNYPSDENYGMSIGTIDLKDCKGYNENHRKYLTKRALALFIDNGNEFKTCYLSPDTIQELNSWRNTVEVVLRLIQGWTMF